MNPPMLSGLTPDALTAPKEKSYFTWVVIVSVLAWLLLAVTLIGPIYALLIGFFLWLGHGLLAAYLRAEAVRVGPDQLPGLHTAFTGVCSRLNVAQPPALYVLQAGGMLNAFALRFAGRDFVVVFSDFLEALGPDSPEMRFVLGHEIGHLRSRHALKQVLLAPGLICPLLGPAYRRSWETSCDRHGAFAADDLGAATRAMLVISGGKVHGPGLNPDAFAAQHTGERGFFISLHELTSPYPTLSRRVTDLLALRNGTPAARPSRHPLAYVLGLFVPGGNMSGSAPGALVAIVMIGLLAAMAIPAFQKVRVASIQRACVNNQRVLAAALDQYRHENPRGASSWDDLVGPGKLVPTMPTCLAGGSYSASYSAQAGYTVTCAVPTHNHAPTEPAAPAPK